RPRRRRSGRGCRTSARRRRAPGRGCTRPRPRRTGAVLPPGQAPHTMALPFSTTTPPRGTHMAGLIDAHVHVWTDDTAHYPLGPGWKKEDMMPRRFTPEDLFKHCKPAGVDRVNLIQMSFYCPLDKSSEKGKGFDNSYMLDMIALYPETFVGTAVI